jgi:hypothetical protein
MAERRSIAELTASRPPTPTPPSRTPDDRLIPLANNHQISLANFTTWVVNVPRQYDIADLLDPALWRQVELAIRDRAGRPKEGDLVRCIAADGSFDAFLAIRSVNRGYDLVYSHGRLPEQDAP